MKKIKYCLILGILLIILSGCYSVPITGRSTFIAISQADEETLGLQAFDEQKQASKLASPELQAKISKIGKDLASVTDQKDWNWQFVVFDDPTVNAWCLPGGKVAVYTGILPYFKNDNELAAVLAHEIAHAIARHGASRMTQNIFMETGAAILGMSTKNSEALALAYGVSTELLVALPYSRENEYEADYIGIILMAKAGYNPQAALDFWQRFATSSAASSTPEFFSTHPSDANRVAHLKGKMPEALSIYNKKR